MFEERFEERSRRGKEFERRKEKWLEM